VPRRVRALGRKKRARKRHERAHYINFLHNDLFDTQQEAKVPEKKNYKSCAARGEEKKATKSRLGARNSLHTRASKTKKKYVEQPRVAPHRETLCMPNCMWTPIWVAGRMKSKFARSRSRCFRRLQVSIARADKKLAISTGETKLTKQVCLGASSTAENYLIRQSDVLCNRRATIERSCASLSGVDVGRAHSGPETLCNNYH
jgi:hypothetical protein